MNKTEQKKAVSEIKDYIVNLALNDNLPMDLNELDTHPITKILNKYNKRSKQEKLKDAVIERAGAYLSNDNIEKAVKKIAKQTKNGLIDNIAGIEVWDMVAFKFTVNQFLEAIGYKHGILG